MNLNMADPPRLPATSTLNHDSNFDLSKSKSRYCSNPDCSQSPPRNRLKSTGTSIKNAKTKKSKKTRVKAQIADENILSVAREASLQNLKALEEKNNQLTNSYSQGSTLPLSFSWQVEDRPLIAPLRAPTSSNFPKSEYIEKYVEWPVEFKKKADRGQSDEAPWALDEDEKENQWMSVTKAASCEADNISEFPAGCLPLEDLGKSAPTFFAWAKDPCTEVITPPPEIKKGLPAFFAWSLHDQYAGVKAIDPDLQNLYGEIPPTQSRLTENNENYKWWPLNEVKNENKQKLKSITSSAPMGLSNSPGADEWISETKEKFLGLKQSDVTAASSSDPMSTELADIQEDGFTQDQSFIAGKKSDLATRGDIPPNFAWPPSKADTDDVKKEQRTTPTETEYSSSFKAVSESSEMKSSKVKVRGEKQLTMGLSVEDMNAAHWVSEYDDNFKKGNRRRVPGSLGSHRKTLRPHAVAKKETVSEVVGQPPSKAERPDVTSLKGQPEVCAEDLEEDDGYVLVDKSDVVKSPLSGPFPGAANMREKKAEQMQVLLRISLNFPTSILHPPAFHSFM